jgi:hypothetical protein
LKIKYSLSSVDSMILEEILSQEEKKTSEVLSKKLRIPLTTIQRRRKQLEKELLKMEYFFRLDEFGWRRIDFFISTRNGNTDEVAKDLLTMEPIIFVGKSIRRHTIDLRVESIVKDNSQILDLMEKMRAMSGIKGVVWSEIVRTVARKSSIPSSVIGQL